jgi:pantothenate kinase
MNRASLVLTELIDLLTSRPSSDRHVIGIVGASGTGKSTVADELARALGPSAVVIPMDGFHLGNTLLEGTPMNERKGAIDTFDIGGYLSLLRRLRRRDEEVVYAPAYRRGLEEPIGASIAVPRDVRFVLTEGNYLLSEWGQWRDVRPQLDEA